jgi:RNA polymerase sigma-B factor
LVSELFVEYYNTKDIYLKEQLLKENLKLVNYIARKFTNRGEALEDVVQVGTIGLLKAIERYDPSHEVEFATYATPTIVGEIKHFFRDKTHLVKIPRRLHELYSKIKKVIYDFTQETGRAPNITEISEMVEVSEEEILESLEAGQARMTVSLDMPTYNTDRTGEQSHATKGSLVESLKEGSEDDLLLNKESLRVAITKVLTRREQRIIYLRFYDNLSQSEIANLLKLSQMHVSRLQAHALKKLQKVINK